MQPVLLDLVGPAEVDLLDPALYQRNPHDVWSWMRENEPVSLRLWSVLDDQVFAVLNGDDCALYALSVGEGYGTSVGNPRIEGAFAGGSAIIDT